MIGWLRQTNFYAFSIKNTFDYVRYLALLQTRESIELIIDLALWIVSGALLYEKLFTPFAIATVFALLGTLRGVAKLQRSTLRFLMKRSGALTRSSAVLSIEGLTDIGTIQPSDLEQSEGFALSTYGDENVVRSDKFDDALRNAENSVNLPVVLDDAALGRIRSRIREHKEVVIPLLTAQFRESIGNKQFHNDEKLCLSDDLLRAKCCWVHVGGYYDTFVTNDIGTLSIRDNDRNERVVDGGCMYPLVFDADRQPRLSRIGGSLANNHLGASVLAITRDGQLVVWEQNLRAMQSNGLLVPTGSGSSDARDRGATLIETVCKTMEREFCEESARRGATLPGNAIRQTKVLGFFRQLRRGGKPEFTGVTRLHVDARQLEPDHTEVTKPTDGRSRTWPAGKAAELQQSMNEITSLKLVSTQLHVAIAALRRYMNEEPTESAQLLFDD